MLAHLPLTAGLNAYARQFSHLSGLQIRVIEKTPKPKIDEETRLAFFRAAQELLDNVSRHAQASSVEISLRHDDPRLVMEVSDDGIGIDPASVNKDGALGLLGIQERFGALGGTFQIQRNEGLGTTVSMSIPVKRSELG
jgi:two-component system, NarL family, sensor histidine kinase UhpB